MQTLPAIKIWILDSGRICFHLSLERIEPISRRVRCSATATLCFSTIKTSQSKMPSIRIKSCEVQKSIATVNISWIGFRSRAGSEMSTGARKFLMSSLSQQTCKNTCLRTNWKWLGNRYRPVHSSTYSPKKHPFTTSSPYCTRIRTW